MFDVFGLSNMLSKNTDTPIIFVARVAVDKQNNAINNIPKKIDLNVFINTSYYFGVMPSLLFNNKFGGFYRFLYEMHFYFLYRYYINFLFIIYHY